MAGPELSASPAELAAHYDALRKRETTPSQFDQWLAARRASALPGGGLPPAQPEQPAAAPAIPLRPASVPVPSAPSRSVGLPKAPELVTITTPGGARFSVAKAHQAPFQGLVNDLEAGGYLLNPKTSGGFNSRYVAGTQTPSEHAFGRAIDVNWDENARGRPGKIPRELALSLADKYGMTWGGTWKNPDDMHFEVRRLTPGGALTKVAVPNATPATPVTYAETGDPQFKSGLAVPQAPPPDTPDPDRQALLASLALQQTQSGPFGASGGGFSAPTSLGDAFAQVVKAGQVPAQPPSTILGAPQYTNVGGPIPLARRIG